MIPSTASSSVITSSDSELMLAPFRSNKNGTKFTTLERARRSLRVTLLTMGIDLSPLPSSHSGISTVN
jgi:hypothetical protein